MLPPMDPQQRVYQQQEETADPARPGRWIPSIKPQMVEYSGKEGAGTIVVDTPNKFLFLVQGNGRRCVTASASASPVSPGPA